MKSLVKELFIGVLLLMIVTITLGIAFYDSMPNNKLAPTSITYTADATVTSTIQQISEEKSKNNNTTSSSNTSSGLDIGSVIASYSIGSTDLSIYESRKNYESGKSDPFEDYKEETSDDGNNGENNNGGDNGNSGSGNNGNNNSSNNGGSNSSSSGKLFENKTTK